MATYIKTLKEDNGDITYPQTKAGAVLLNNGSDLETELSQYVTAEDIASTSALTPPVQTNMIANGAVTTGKIANKAVTSDKINWTTLYKSATPLSATLPVNANTETDVQRLNLPAGKWRIFWAVRGYGDSSQVDVVSAGLKVDGDKVQSLAENIVTIGALRPNISSTFELNTTGLKTVKTYITMPMAGNISVETTYLFALRVG